MTQSLQHLIVASAATTDVIVQLFTLDASRYGIGVFHFTPGVVGSQAVVYQGLTYEPVPVQITGLEITSQGSQPRPKLSLSNFDLPVGGAPFIPLFIKTSGDLVGSTLSRVRVWQQHLDNGSNPDSGAHWPAQAYIVDRKSLANKTTLEWELANPIDQRNVNIPGRTALKDTCSQNYRAWIGTGFDYTKATCPFSDATYYTYKSVSTPDPSQDQCGKRLNDCRLRFGQTATLPFEGFPGMRITS